MMDPQITTSPPYIKAADDEITIHAPVPTEVIFTYENFYCRILPRVITYRISAMLQDAYDDQLLHCMMVGTDHSLLNFHLTRDDLRHNIALVALVADDDAGVPLITEIAA